MPSHYFPTQIAQHGEQINVIWVQTRYVILYTVCVVNRSVEFNDKLAKIGHAEGYR